MALNICSSLSGIVGHVAIVFIDRFSTEHNETALPASYKAKVRQIASTFYRDHKLYKNMYPNKYNYEQWFSKDTLISLEAKSTIIQEHVMFADAYEQGLIKLIDAVHDAQFEFDEKSIYEASNPRQNYNHYRSQLLEKKKKRNKSTSIPANNTNLKRNEPEHGYLVHNYLTLWDSKLYIDEIKPFLAQSNHVCDRIMNNVIRDPVIKMADAAMIIKERILQTCGKRIKLDNIYDTKSEWIPPIDQNLSNKAQIKPELSQIKPELSNKPKIDQKLSNANVIIIDDDDDED